mmetsp:Transcript_10500/g.25441  ORF Transcript_10500/g.25441 Transcript_10500/m.25441 type:complete len:99 (+) Transcript_10500:1390-1686(+)
MKRTLHGSLCSHTHTHRDGERERGREYSKQLVVRGPTHIHTFSTCSIKTDSLSLHVTDLKTHIHTQIQRERAPPPQSTDQSQSPPLKLVSQSLLGTSS